MLQVIIAGTSRTEAASLRNELLRATAVTQLSGLVTLELLGKEPDRPAPSIYTPVAARLTLLLALEGSDTGAQQADTDLRRQLSLAGQAFDVLYGSAPERELQALELIDKHTTRLNGGHVDPISPTTAPAHPTARQAWKWTCDTCSDPVCEHHLLSELLARRHA